jgi:uncharacterized DUF497 family protein
MLEFEWDVENLTHIAEHGVDPDELEFALNHDPFEIEYQDWHDTEERYAEIGMTAKGRFLYLNQGDEYDHTQTATVQG